MLQAIEKLVLFQLAPKLDFVLDNHVYTARSGLCIGLKRKGGLGFLPQIGRLTVEHSFLSNLELKGKTVFDVGAADGLFSCFFASKVGPMGKVIAFEPNLRLCKRTLENLSLNKFDNAQVMNYAVGSMKETVTLHFSSKIPTAGSLAPEEINRISKLRDTSTQKVSIDTIDNMIREFSLPEPDFVKIDVQGFERQVLEGMKQTILHHKPELLVEIHSIPKDSWKTTNLKDILDKLGNFGYRVIHVETGLSVKPEEFNSDEHLYAQ